MSPEPLTGVGGAVRLFSLLWDKTLGGWLFRRSFKGVEFEGRYFVWEGEGPVHRIEETRQPAQLFEFYERLCWHLRKVLKPKGLLPVFGDESNLGEIPVLETDARRSWKRKLVGGSGGAAGTQFLHLRPRRGEPDEIWCVKCGALVTGVNCSKCGTPENMSRPGGAG
jgi:hypothetical protein